MKHNIQVRIKRSYGNPGALLGTIKRKLRAECFGNFNPIFCTYNHTQHPVISFSGDISDPFRRTDKYLKTLYIEI